MKQHFRELRSFSQQLNRRHFILTAGLWLIDWTCAWGLFAAYDKWGAPFQESTASILLFILCLLYILCLYPFIRWYRRVCRVNLTRMARRIEQASPELNDLLITATHLEAKNLSDPNPLEAHVLDSARQRLNEIDWKQKATHPLERNGTVYGTLIVGILLAILSFKTIPLQKAIHHIHDDFGQAPTGLVISPLPDEVPAPGDLNVGIKINRWQKQAWIDWIDSEGQHREPVVVDSAGAGVFTFYGMTGPIQFRFETPSLRSQWINLEVYSPARIDALQITVAPPAYTRLPEQVLEGIRDIQTVEGSRLKMEIHSQTADKIELVTGDSAAPLELKEDGFFSTNLHPEKTTPYSFKLIDSKGRESRTASKTLTILPDNPPTVEILHPTKDSVLAPEDIFPVELFAADDFGLTRGRIHLALSGTDQPPLEIPLEELFKYDDAGQTLPLTEAALVSHLDLGILKASDGDLLAIHIEVEDNREPVPNLTRSDLLFIEIRAPVEPMEMDGMPMDQKPIDFRELIEEQKRLLRETHRLNTASPSTRDAMMQEIPAGLSSLAVEIQRIFNEVQETLVSTQRNDLTALFMRALAENSRAIQALENDQAAESVSPQSASLSALLKLENAFRQNTKSKNPSKGSSGEGESGESEEQQQKGPSEGKTVTEALKEAMAKLEQMIQEQNVLISEYDRAAQSSWSKEQAQENANKQEQLGEDARNLRRELNSLNGSEAAGQSLAEARQHMKAAAGKASGMDADGALRDGFRSREALRFAASELAAMLAEAASQELESAAQAAGQLASEQAEAAGASEAAANEGASESEMAAMEENQRDLKERFDQLLETMQQRARQAAGTSPQLSESLQQAAQKAGERGTSGNMERAANALLYGQAGMASPTQASAASEIAELAGDLQAARERMANDPTRRARALNRELQATLEELASQARNPEAAPKERLPEIQKEWNSRFMELQQLSGNPQFGNLSENIAGKAMGDWDGQLSATRTTLQQGARLLREFLFNEASQSDLQMNREAAPPPDQYRKMVEEYFRRLAREPEQR